MGSIFGKLKLLATARDMDEEKLAEATKIPLRTINSYLSQGRKPPPFRALLLAEALGVSLNRLADDRLDDRTILDPEFQYGPELAPEPPPKPKTRHTRPA